MPPLVTAVTGLISAISTFAASSWLAGFAVRVVLSIGFSVLSRALRKTPKSEQPGISTKVTQTGGDDAQAFIVGRYATGGQLVAPPMTHGSLNGTPNAYLTYVIALSDLPGVSLSKVFIDGHDAPVGGAAHPQYGTPMALKGNSNRAWVKFYDGGQSVADPMLLAKYGTHARRPWLADMAGAGVAYAVLTFRFDRELFKSFPGVRFEIDGIPLYDPRRDPSLGGAGSHSWSNPATWEQTGNPVVIAYNILRGIPVPGGDVWGGGWDAADLPLAEWITAMNVCDEPVSLAAGGTEPRYRCGFEIAVDDQPADILDDLMKTCAGRMADIGGVMKIVVGAPGLPVTAIADEDIIVTDEQSQSLFPSLAQTHNGVHATFPDPASLWESRDAPPRYDAAAEFEDGRRLVATVSLPACPYANQVQRLMQAWISEERRFRRHQLVLPPDAAILEPLDVISWTSAANGYSAKLFEVVEIAHDPVSLLQAASLREVDPADYDWSQTLELPWVAPVAGTDLPTPQAVPAFAANGIALDDANGVPRRPAIVLTWDGNDQDDVSALEYELRLQLGAQILSGATLAVASGSHVISAGILPDTIYEARARFIAPRPVLWTAWVQAITPPAYVSPADFAGGLDQLFADANLSPPRVVAALPAGNPNGWQLVFLTTDAKLYRWDEVTGEWTTEVTAGDIADGAIVEDHIAVDSLDANRLRAGTVVAGLFAAGAVKAADMQIDNLLAIDATDAGFAMGKASAGDFLSDGIYMGRSVKLDGSLGYSFLMGTTRGGVHQYIQASADDGLAIVNADFSLFSTVLSSNAVLTVSQTVDLPVGSKYLNLDALGAGGGGGVYAAAGHTPASGGGPTIIELWDGLSPTGVSWTAPGGAAGQSTNSQLVSSGQGSSYGAGGAAGYGSYTSGRDDDVFHPAQSGGNATGQGAGGGGGAGDNGLRSIGGQGGRKGASLSVRLFDISGLANPRLVVSIGAAGVRGTPGPSSASAGGNGSPGRVSYETYSSSPLPAGVITRSPAVWGQFARAADQIGGLVFPNYFPGLWTVSCPTGALQMSIEASPGAAAIVPWDERTVTFIASQRPVVLSASANAKTYNYNFHPMKV